MNHGTCRHGHAIDGDNIHRPTKGHRRGFAMCLVCHLATEELGWSSTVPRRQQRFTAKQVKELADKKYAALTGAQS